MKDTRKADKHLVRVNDNLTSIINKAMLVIAGLIVLAVVILIKE